jgi:hypothetical protein
MSDLVYGIRSTVEHDERVRNVLLAAFTALLAAAFMLLLISDQVAAAL